jgi:tetratricopeptide (TPR) repeat protein
MGESRRIFDGAGLLLEYGDENANSRSKVFGHYMKAFGHWAGGDLDSVRKSSETAIEVALDPFYAQFPKTTLGASYLLSGRFQEAEEVFRSAIEFCENRALDELSVPCQLFLSPILIAKGQMQQGMDMMAHAQESLIKNHRRGFYAMSEYILGEVHFQIATAPRPSLSILAKNIGFLIKNIPSAKKRAEKHYSHAIELFEEMGMKSFLGQGYLSLGKLHKTYKRRDKARQCILASIDCFQECGAEAWLKQANEALHSLG